MRRCLPRRVLEEQLPGVELFDASSAHVLLRHGTHMGSQSFLTQQQQRQAAAGAITAMVSCLLAHAPFPP